jgi:hypothetical protein
MTEGYAAEPGGDLPLFHALLLMDHLERLPARFTADLDYVRLMMDLTDDEFEEAVDLCARRNWIRLIKGPRRSKL